MLVAHVAHAWRKKAPLHAAAVLGMNRARTHEKEIGARPKKTWFQSEGDKQKLKQMSNAMVNGVDLMTQVEE